jgi:hypothetical protein
MLDRTILDKIRSLVPPSAEETALLDAVHRFPSARDKFYALEQEYINRSDGLDEASPPTNGLPWIQNPMTKWPIICDTFIRKVVIACGGITISAAHPESVAELITAISDAITAVELSYTGQNSQSILLHPTNWAQGACTYESVVGKVMTELKDSWATYSKDDTYAARSLECMTNSISGGRPVTEQTYPTGFDTWKDDVALIGKKLNNLIVNIHEGNTSKYQATDSGITDLVSTPIVFTYLVLDFLRENLPSAAGNNYISEADFTTLETVATSFLT